MNTKGIFFAGIAIFAIQPVANAADEAIAWNEIALQAIKRANTPPPMAARNLAISSLAMSDAVNAISGSGPGYAYNAIGPATASKEVAVAQAAYSSLVQLFPTQKDFLDQQWAARSANFSSTESTVQGKNLGRESAAAILSLRANDGSTNMGSPYMGSTAVGAWRPTGPGFAPGALPNWKNVTPFTLQTGSQFRPEAGISLTSAQYTAAFNEVKMYGALNSTVRTQDQTEIAMFWKDAGGSVTPPGHWNRIAQTAATTSGRSLEQNVQMFSTLNVALADAGIAAWDVKYTDLMWRPETAIQNADLDGNPLTTKDAAWQPLITTPNHPTCVSGHSTFSSAGATVLSAMFGNNFSFTDYADGLPLQRSYSSFYQAAQEAGMSRIYGGIHFQFDNQIGQELGAKVGAYALNRMTPVPEPASVIGLSLAALGLLKRKRK